jgi:hypothetical protein
VDSHLRRKGEQSRKVRNAQIVGDDAPTAVRRHVDEPNFARLRWKPNRMAAAGSPHYTVGQTEGPSAAVGRRWPIERCAVLLSGGGVQPSASRGKPLARSAGTRQNARNPARLSRKRLGQRQELTRQLATTFAPSAVQRRTSCIGCCTIVYVGALGCTKGEVLCATSSEATVFGSTEEGAAYTGRRTERRCAPNANLEATSAASPRLRAVQPLVTRVHRQQ